MRTFALVIPMAGILAAGIPAEAESVRSKIKQGIEKYEQGDYQGAAEVFLDAHIDAPEQPEPAFDLGAALYKQNRHEEALQGFTSMPPPPSTRMRADNFYNMGNTLYRLGEAQDRMDTIQTSIENYKKTLRLDPNFDEAKYNLELALRKLKQMEQEQQDDQQQEDQQQEDQQQDQQQQQQQQNSDGQQPPPEPDQEQSQSDRSQSPPQNQQSRMSPQELTEEQAKRLLQMVENEEADLKDVMQALYGSQFPPVGKDW